VYAVRPDDEITDLLGGVAKGDVWTVWAGVDAHDADAAAYLLAGAQRVEHETGAHADRRRDVGPV
jgi:hypothetical protein